MYVSAICELHLNMQWIGHSYDKIIVTIVPSYTRNIYHLFVCCRWHCYSCCAPITMLTNHMSLGYYRFIVGSDSLDTRNYMLVFQICVFLYNSHAHCVLSRAAVLGCPVKSRWNTPWLVIHSIKKLIILVNQGSTTQQNTNLEDLVFDFCITQVLWCRPCTDQPCLSSIFRRCVYASFITLLRQFCYWSGQNRK